ncbi:MAG TPA: hypothetical protein ENI85_14590 [Deltaproteobacteria bacterium]|nr:hypothetical protein [Deltaproteobacteria bacterium]
MLRYEKSAPIWLFSFVDLAFLLLIAFTQIGPETEGPPLELGELEIPRIHGPAPPLERDAAAAGWQLRVYPVDHERPREVPRTPFALTLPGTNAAPGPAPKPSPPTAGSDSFTAALDATELAAHLRLLRDRGMGRPILAPHRDSRSEDLLIAVGLIEEIWEGGRTVAVAPGPAVASGPPEAESGQR